MRISLVVAVSRNGIIGAEGRLPWHLPGELRLFKEITWGHPLVMGRRTFESIGRALPGRDTIVVSRGPRLEVPGVETFASLEGALARAADQARARAVDEIMVVGGGEIYRAALPLAERIYLTRVEIDVEGDTRFPDLDPAEWRETSWPSPEPDPRDSARWSLTMLERMAKADVDAG